MVMAINDSKSIVVKNKEEKETIAASA